MDLEQLTKHQILLLALLVSFVTSIATGIVTVSLMDQAPEGVTRVINQIVERTVETVVPDNQSAAVATEKTVVVQQDELVPQSIAAVQKSIIRIVREGEQDTLARGIMLDAQGLAATDRAVLGVLEDHDLEAILPTGERVRLAFRSDSTGSTMLINLVLGTSTGFTPATVADASKLTLGQTVLRIGGNTSDNVAEGVIAALPAVEGDRAGVVEASVAAPIPGSVLITVFGEVVGISTPSLSPNNDAYTIITLPTPASVTTTQSSS